MSMPVGDAFSFNRHHPHPIKRRSSRPPTRSPSPFALAGPPVAPAAPNCDREHVAPPAKPVRRRSSREGTPLQRAASFGPPNGTAHHANGHAASLAEIDEDAPESERAAPQKIDWEIPRKTFHSSIGFLVLPLYTNHYPLTPVTVALGASLAFVVSMDVMRFNSPAVERKYECAVGFLMRESEKHKVNGVVWYLIGALFVLLVLPLDIAVVAILLLSWADTAASTFGRMFGARTPPLPRSVKLLAPLVRLLPASLRGRILRVPAVVSIFSVLHIPFAPRKSVAGLAAASATGAIVAASFWGLIAPLGSDSPVWSWGKGVLGNGIGLAIVSLFTGVVAGLAEAMDVGSLDDNLTLPVISGTTLWAFFKIANYFS